MSGLYDSFVAFLNQPFQSDMSAKQWFAFIGLIIACMMAWNIVLNALREV